MIDQAPRDDRPSDETNDMKPDDAADPTTADSSAAEAVDAAMAATDDGESTATAPTAEQQIADLGLELANANDRFLRLQAELENYRKRTQRTMQEERQYASVPLMQDLLTVVDNLQRAIAAAEQHGNASALLEGVKMVAQHLSDVLSKYHCEPIEANGQPFDPHYHEAIGQQPSAEVAPGTVTHVATVGYRLHDRVIRPSQVLVAVAAEEPKSDPSSETDAADDCQASE